MYVVAHKFNHGIDVNPASHMTDEIDQCRDADKGQRNTNAEREMRDEATLALGPNASQHDKRIGEGPEEYPKRQLVAAIAGEIAQQPRPHLTGCQRQCRDRDRKYRTRHTDRR